MCQWLLHKRNLAFTHIINKNIYFPLLSNIIIIKYILTFLAKITLFYLFVGKYNYLFKMVYFGFKKSNIIIRQEKLLQAYIF